jgi:hypothetical protein
MTDGVGCDGPSAKYLSDVYPGRAYQHHDVASVIVG